MLKLLNYDHDAYELGYILENKEQSASQLDTIMSNLESQALVLLEHSSDMF